MDFASRFRRKIASLLGEKELLDEIRSPKSPLHVELEGLTRLLNELKVEQEIALEMIRVLYEQPEQRREELSRLRETQEYKALLGDTEPLVSVRIATYNNAEVLAERALASVFRQTYENYEIIVVGDRCTDETEDVIRKLNNKKVRFHNLLERGRYPESPQARWMVAGTVPMNVGAELANGAWIAPLDDDDEFTEDHIEVLLHECLKNRVELSYGKFRWHSDNEEKILGAFPPRQGDFGFQAAIYSCVLRLFKYDVNAWILREPGDWNLCRRMYEAGVTMGFVDKIVADVHFDLQAERKGSVTRGSGG